ncbi:hypothetical protein [Erythrobacter sp. EC-HK427]|uniref:hypothetical protein n=1 Tax=Erythrobacter sp. EC-HK427 TaxID=2038396 RepID=UPI001255C386|nr:hypothetical protein [Erythrobacter sp. EC-HK427]VVS96025.1 hypothetical protein ERY430_30006 [Erythrobacter sp. EC-HK427]
MISKNITNFVFKITILAGLIGVPACHATHGQEVAFGIDVPLSEVVFDRRLQGEHIYFAQQDYPICRAGFFPRPNWSLATITSISGNSRLRFAAPEGQCVFRIAPPGAILSRERRNTLDVSSADCDVLITINDEAISSIEYVGTNDETQFNNCMFRIALFLQGFNGVMTLSDNVLFVERRLTPWVGLAVAPNDVPLFQLSARRCGFEVSEYVQNSEIPSACMQ